MDLEEAGGGRTEELQGRGAGGTHPAHPVSGRRRRSEPVLPAVVYLVGLNIRMGSS